MHACAQVLSRSNVAMAMVQESMRLKPPVPFTFRCATQDSTVGDVFVPKGTRVVASLADVSPPYFFCLGPGK